MAKHLPIKSLVRLNLLLSVVIGGTVFLFLHLDLYQHYSFLFAGMTSSIFALIGFANIGILIILSKRDGVNPKKFNQYRYFFTYLFSATAYFSLWPVFAAYSDRRYSMFDPDLVATFLISSILVNTLIIISQNFVLLQHEKTRADAELSSLKMAHSEATNLLLTQQIHPHFLFNALNMLKSLYRRDHDAGDSYMVHLANFLRASISINASGVSKLDEELTLLRDYLEMQKIRFGAALVCTIDVPEDSLRNFYMPTFSLQPLLENALKHNELTEEMPLTVMIYQEGDRIIVSNTLRKKKQRESSTNKGLANLRERYRLLSSDEIIIDECQELFLVSLKLLTNEYSDHRG